MTITFAGHKDLYGPPTLMDALKKAILFYTAGHDEPVTFLLGLYGKFDVLCAEAVRDLKATHPNFVSVFVTPYLDDRRLSDPLTSKLYDVSEYPPLENTPLRFAISKRNAYMIQKSDVVIAFVSHTWGGAYKSLQMAKRACKTICNLAQTVGVIDKPVV